MLPLFRKIRWQLAQGNQFFKYSRYAIGEIILVVVGILIALQINNWNEDRKTAKQEIKILKELKNDLETNLNEINESYSTTLDRELSAKLVLEYFDTSKPFDDSLKLAFENLKMDVLFNIANTSYKFIESQGFNSLTNDSLRIRITEMYERHLKNIITRENRNWDMIDEELMPLMMEHFVSTPTADENLSFSVEAINTPLDLGALRQDPKFRNVIVRLQGFFLMRLRWQKEAMDTLEQLILDVQKEIERIS